MSKKLHFKAFILFLHIVVCGLHTHFKYCHSTTFILCQQNGEKHKSSTLISKSLNKKRQSAAFYNASAVSSRLRQMTQLILCYPTRLF